MGKALKNGAGRSEKKIVALGELLVDLVPGRPGMRIEDSGPVIKTASGSAGIFACAVSRLGAPSGFIGKVGRDSLSRMALSALKDQGVDVSKVVVSQTGQIGLAFLEYLPDRRNYQYYRSNSAGSQLCDTELDEAYIADACAVHFPGMLLELTPQMRMACERFVQVARENNVPVSFDPNIRRELSSDHDALLRLKWAVRHADIVEPTLTEGQMITGKSGIGDVLRSLHAMGPRIVALTRDKDGMVLSRDGNVAIAAGIDEEPVDPTGAGDTLAAALCVGLREDMPIEKLARFCNCAGTCVIKKEGAIGMALPSRAEVEEFMKCAKCRVHTCTLADIA